MKKAEKDGSFSLFLYVLQFFNLARSMIQISTYLNACPRANRVSEIKSYYGHIHSCILNGLCAHSYSWMHYSSASASILLIIDTVLEVNYTNVQDSVMNFAG